jgi:hypothetical protein
MIKVRKAPNDQTRPSAWPYLGEEERLCSWKNDLLGGVFCQASTYKHGLQLRKKFFRTNDARMLLKTKDPCGKLGGKAGICMKTRHLSSSSGNVVENKSS